MQGWAHGLVLNSFHGCLWASQGNRGTLTSSWTPAPSAGASALPSVVKEFGGVGSGGPGGNRAHGGGGGGSTKGLLRTAMVNIPNNLFLFTFLHEICIS